MERLLPVAYYPSQMEISIGEKCNLACDYCFVDKSGPSVAGIAAIRRAIDVFYGYPAGRRTVTFTTMEPFLHAKTWRLAVEYLLAQADLRGVELERIITTTNGVLLDDEAREFISGTDERLWINISLDGRPESHDRHRRLAGRRVGSSFDLAWENFKALPRDRARIICTVAPDQAERFRENADFFLENGFRHIDVFPDILTLWPPRKLEHLRRGLEGLIRDLNRAGGAYNLRLLNRLWGRPFHDKILFGSDEKFYLYEGVLLIPYEERKRFMLGGAHGGVDLRLRQELFGELFAEMARRTGGGGAGDRRDLRGAFPTPLLLWCRSRGLDFSAYFESFERVAKTFIKLSSLVEAHTRNQTDTVRLNEMRWGRAT